MLEVDTVSVHYGAVSAIINCSMEVRLGEIVCLIGPNGAGKSSLLKAISGLIPLTTGNIKIEGYEISNLPGYRVAQRGVAHVPEGRHLFPGLTVEENLRIGAVARGRHGNIRDALVAIYKIFPALEVRRGQRAWSLSGGEQQMVAIGRALMSNPKLLMLDEPSLGLSPIMVESMFDSVEQLRSDGLTILLVEQNAKEALRLADRGYVLEGGEIVLDGDARALSVNPAVQNVYFGKA